MYEKQPANAVEPRRLPPGELTARRGILDEASLAVADNCEAIASRADEVARRILERACGVSQPLPDATLNAVAGISGDALGRLDDALTVLSAPIAQESAPRQEADARGWR